MTPDQLARSTSGPRRLQVAGDRFHPRIPAGAVYVGREAPYLPRSTYANPHTIGKPCRACGGATVHDRPRALRLFRRHLDQHPELVDQARVELAGRDLACWCRLDDACHADMAGDRQPTGRRRMIDGQQFENAITDRLAARKAAAADRITARRADRAELG